jgi:2-haloacid dehalogenase
MIDWSSVRALTFDCYGTIVDWETGILRDLRAGLATSASDDQLLDAYADVETALEAGAFLPYKELLVLALAHVGDTLGAHITDPQTLARGLPTWPPFPDSAAALASLAKRFRLCVVSNVDRDLFAATDAALGSPFAEIVTADQVRSYKPATAHFEEALRRLALDRSAVVHVAQSLFHDIEPARALGFRTVWVDRRGGRAGGATRPPRGTPSPDLVVRSLAELDSVAR